MQIGDNFQEIPNPFFWEKYYMLSAENFTQSAE